MAKNKKDVTTVSPPVVSGSAPIEATTSAGGTSARSTPTPTIESKQADRSLSDQLVGGLADTARVVRRVLPNRLPAYLAGGALLVVGVIEPPVALAGGLTYEALRRWQPNPTS